MRLPHLLLLALPLLAACTEDATTSDATTASNETVREPLGTIVPASTCENNVASTVPGIRVQFTMQKCSFTLAEAKAGIALEYVVIVDGALPEGFIQGGPGRAPIGNNEQIGEKTEIPGQGGYFSSFGATVTGKKVSELEPGVYRIRLTWDGVLLGQTAPRPGTYEFQLGTFFYANPNKQMEEWPTDEVRGLMRFTITN